jgi:protein SCO1/2
MKTRSFSSILLLISLAVLVMVAAFVVVKVSKPSIPPELVGVLRPQVSLIREFQLTDQHGEKFDNQSLNGKWSFVFFGYTFCPDICPTTLAVLTAMQKQLQHAPENWSDTQVVFVSVDPERDTQEILANYMDFFNKEFYAVTGSRSEIDKLTRQFGAGYIIEPETSPGHYLVSHTGAIFLTDSQGALVASFSMPHDPGLIASLYRQIRKVF